MNVNMRLSLGIALVLAGAALPLASADHWLPNCPHSSPHSHTYGFGGSAGARSDTVTGGDEVGAGIVTVSETNTVDCDGDFTPDPFVGCWDDPLNPCCLDEEGNPESCCYGPDDAPTPCPESADFDGDYETGVGGGFFGYGPWAHEPTCNYGLTDHSGTVVVNDIVHGGDVAFVIGADDTSGPVVEVDPVDGTTSCSTDGSITPGDPATDPTADADDCLSEVYIGTGTTCGAGGDGGYWVFLNGALVTEGAGGVGANNAPTTGTITA